MNKNRIIRRLFAYEQDHIVRILTPHLSWDQTIFSASVANHFKF